MNIENESLLKKVCYDFAHSFLPFLAESNLAGLNHFLEKQSRAKTNLFLIDFSMNEGYNCLDRRLYDFKIPRIRFPIYLT